MESWISEQNRELVLNFADYSVKHGGNCSIKLFDIIDYVNPNFLRCMCGEEIDPVLWVVNKEEAKKDIELMALMNVENNIREYEGKYKLDVVKTFGEGIIKPYDESRINTFGAEEDGIAVMYDVIYEGRGGVISSNTFLYLKTALSVESENIEGKDYLIVNNGTKVYWEKLG